VGQTYDTTRTYSLIGRVQLFNATGQWVFMPPSQPDRHICTDSILRPLLSVSPAISAAVHRIKSALDEPSLGSFSLNDALRLSELLPSHFTEVSLPSVFRVYRSQDNVEPSLLNLILTASPKFFPSRQAGGASTLDNYNSSSHPAALGGSGLAKQLYNPAASSSIPSPSASIPSAYDLMQWSSAELAKHFRERLHKRLIKLYRFAWKYFTSPSVLFMNVFTLVRHRLPLHLYNLGLLLCFYLCYITLTKKSNFLKSHHHVKVVTSDSALTTKGHTDLLKSRL